jgi:hypothetical protein
MYLKAFLPKAQEHAARVPFRRNPVPDERAPALKAAKLSSRKVLLDGFLQPKDVQTVIPHETL